MTPREQLEALARRCEEASGPDRELDRDIGIDVLGWVTFRGYGCDMVRDHEGNEHADSPGGTYPALTELLDEALTLVPDGLYVNISQMHQGVVGGYARVFGPGAPYLSDLKVHGESIPTPEHRATPPLALCAAALRARAALAALVT